MAVFGSLSTSARAMNAHSHHMNTIGSNIANINTTAYKEVETLYQTQRNKVTPTGSFFAVNTVDVRRTNAQGIITSTNRSLDAAINGRGFFVTNSKTDGTGDTRYTRDGSFMGEAYSRGVDSNGDGNIDQGTYLVTGSGDYVMGYAADANGNYSKTLTAIDYANDALDPGKPTTEITVRGNVPAANGSPRSHNMNLPVVQQVTENGITTTRSHAVNLALTPQNGAAGTWTLSATGDKGIAGVTTTPAQISFLGNGLLNTATGTDKVTLNIAYDNGTTQAVTLNLKQFTQYSGDSELTVMKMDHNGYTSGALEETYFSKQGVLMGRFSNAIEKPLYKLPLATFPSPEKLEALKGNMFQETAESGGADLVLLDAGDTMSEVMGGNLERSSVNLEDQFSKMITTQRAYSSAATVFRTSDEMSQTARDLMG